MLKTKLDFFVGNAGMMIEWKDDMYGYGRFEFLLKPDGSLEIDNEGMSKEFVKKVLCDVVDNATLLDGEK